MSKQTLIPDTLPASWEALFSSLPPPAYRVGDRIVTPGYNAFRSGLAIVGEPGPELISLPAGSSVYPLQGDSSMCTCELCTSRPSWEAVVPPSYSPSSWQSGTIKIDIDNKTLANMFPDASKWKLNLTKPKEQAMSSDTQHVIEDLRELDESELPRISREIDSIKTRNKLRIEESLEGVAKMALLDSSLKTLRPFVISYFKDGKVNTLQGVELGRSNLVAKESEEKEMRIFVFGRDYPVSGTQYTMARLEKALEDSKIVYHIEYRED